MTGSSQKAGEIKIAVVTGGHSFDVLNFHRLFRCLKGVDTYIQHMDDFASSPQEVRDSYDAVLFYTMLREGPTDEGMPWYAGQPKTALEHLGDTEQGIFMLHHAILAYPQWQFWSDLCGIQERSFGYHADQTIQVELTHVEHPITKGLTTWDMVDETYTMSEPGEGNEILLTVDHPNSMRAVAWTRTYKKTRVFCYALGHDNQAWSNPSFRTVLERGIRWVAGKESTSVWSSS